MSKRSIRPLSAQGRRQSASALRHRLFPLTFFCRNMVMLTDDPRWRRRPVRIRRLLLERLLVERCLFFRSLHGVYQRSRKGTGRAAGPYYQGESPAGGYCDNCGGCCEIASGYPQFPPAAELDGAWRKRFADGLGRGHLFCPFLLEVRWRGRSLCAIHPWRPIPCRLFERDECERLKADAHFQDLSRRCLEMKSFRWIPRFIGGGVK